jgi:hypothetical protein
MYPFARVERDILNADHSNLESRKRILKSLSLTSRVERENQALGCFLHQKLFKTEEVLRHTT